MWQTLLYDIFKERLESYYLLVSNKWIKLAYISAKQHIATLRTVIANNSDNLCYCYYFAPYILLLIANIENKAVWTRKDVHFFHTYNPKLSQYKLSRGCLYKWLRRSNHPL